MSVTGFAAILAVVFVALAPAVYAATPRARAAMSAPRPEGPRKVIIGTSIFPTYAEHPGLSQRLEELGTLIDEMADEAQRKYGRPLDLALMVENAVTSRLAPELPDKAREWNGQIADFFAAKAKQHGCYIVVPMHLSEDRERGVHRNSGVLIDRDGRRVGAYNKYFTVSVPGAPESEGGVIPGNSFPVFDCDFGRLGIQICWDMTYEDGWRALAEQGAEIIAWPTMSPQTIAPAARAFTHRYYVVSATARDNATIYDPSGQVAARITPPDRVLVEEIDLDFALMHWQPRLREGQVLTEAYGDRVGYRYCAQEDTGVFWSNDPEMSIRRMLEEQQLVPYEAHAGHSREVRDRLAR